MIKVTMEFESIDEALVELSKMVGDVANVVTPKKPPTRKPRNDKGKKRSAYKDPGENPKPSSATATPAAVAEQPGSTDAGKAPHSAAASPTSTSPDPVPSAEHASVKDSQAMIEKLFVTKGVEVAIAVLEKFGVTRARDLTEEQRADFIKKSNDVIGGGEV